jgi:hypothetical protein
MSGVLAFFRFSGWNTKTKHLTCAAIFRLSFDATHGTVARNTAGPTETICNSFQNTPSLCLSGLTPLGAPQGAPSLDNIWGKISVGSSDPSYKTLSPRYMINTSAFQIAVLCVVTPVVLQAGIDVLEEYTASIFRAEVLRAKNRYVYIYIYIYI